MRHDANVLVAVLLAAGVALLLTLGGCGTAPRPTPTAGSAPPEAETAEPPALDPDRAELRSLLAAQTKMLGLVEHVRAGIPLSRIPESHLLGVLEMSAAQFDLQLPDQAAVRRQELDAPGLTEDVFQTVTGRSKAEWEPVLRKNSKAVEATLAGSSDVWALPAEVWDYLTAMTGRSRQQWLSLPDEVGALMETGFDCPSCRTHHEPRQMMQPAGDDVSYLGKQNPSALHFRCPKCRVHFVWDVATGQTEVRPD